MALPTRMMQVHYDGHGGPDVVRIGEAPVPTPGEGEVLIKVAAAGVNRPDLMQRAGSYPPPRGESAIPGLEVSGHVVAAGPGVTRWREGDAVCALVGSGGYAAYSVAAADLCLPVPTPLGVVEAGGIPETLFTVWDNVFTRGKLKAGERFLVHGGSSGIGSMAIQLAKASGAEVFTTAGSDSKCAFCRKLGADHAINYHATEFVAEITRIAGRAPLDVVLDMVGGDYLAKNISLLRTDGRLVQIAFLNGTVAHEIDFSPMLVRRLTLMGSTLRARSRAEKVAVAEALRAGAWPHLEDGRVRPVIHATFPLAQTREAQELMESSAHLGKILLLPEG